jgi:hypothetical protein
MQAVNVERDLGLGQAAPLTIIAEQVQPDHLAEPMQHLDALAGPWMFGRELSAEPMSSQLLSPSR